MSRIFISLGICAVFMAGMVLYPSTSWAQGKVQYQKRTVINFDDDTIEGDLSRPDGEYFELMKKRKFKSLIKVRTNFRPEILKSVRGL